MLRVLNRGVLVLGLLVASVGFYRCRTGERPLRQPQNTQRWSVERVSDGDTITVVRNGEERRIRFCGIDAPETDKGDNTGQPGGRSAQIFVADAIARSNNEVGLVFVERDRYGRWVAEVFTDLGENEETFLNGQLIVEGLAWPYKRYWDNCPNKLSLETAEKMAEQSGKGIWRSPGAVPPWEFRRK